MDKAWEKQRARTVSAVGSRRECGVEYWCGGEAKKNETPIRKKGLNPLGSVREMNVEFPLA